MSYPLSFYHKTDIMDINNIRNNSTADIISQIIQCDSAFESS